MSMQYGSFSNSQNTTSDEVLTLISSIKVLIVDHNLDFLASISNILSSYSFEVTSIHQSGDALRLLTKKNEFDLLLINSDMSDVDVHTFLRITKNMDMLSMVMSEEQDDSFLYEAFKSGAFLVVKRPLTIDIVMHIRQHIIREKMHKHEMCKNESMVGKVSTKEITLQENRSFGGKRKERGKQRKQVCRSYFDDNKVPKSFKRNDEPIKKKICMEWTQELHKKFLDAVDQLGEGRCYPKEILELMGVPGLTRMQVASHLQKCRNEGWKSNEKPRISTSPVNYTSSSSTSRQRANGKKFGCIPPLQMKLNDKDHSDTLIDVNLSTGGRPTHVKRYGQHAPYSTLGSGSHAIGQASNCHTLSSSGRQASDDFFGFLLNLDGDGSIRNKDLNGLTPNEYLMSNTFPVDYNSDMSSKDHTIPHKHI